MAASNEFVVLVEPLSALYRYCELIQRRYKTLILAHDPKTARESENNYNRTWHIPKSHIDEIVGYEAVSVDSMLHALQPYRGRIAGVLPGEECFVPIAAQLGRALGFDCALPEDAPCQHLKTAMKRRLTERGVSTPNFAVVRGFDEAVATWESFGRDCMVKMVDMQSSINIFRVKDLDQLRSAWGAIFDRQHLHVPYELSREVVLEEFVGGRELSVEGYVQDQRVEILNSCEKLTESNFIIVGHYLPAQLSTEEAGQLADIARQCVRALGVRNSPFHVEVHLDRGTPYVIECAARPPGQHIAHLIEQCYGFDLMEIAIDLAVGRRVDITARPPRSYYALFTLYTRESGIFEGFDGWDELHARGGVVHASLYVRPGDRVHALDAFHQKYGFVVLRDSTPGGVRDQARWLREHVRMVVRDADDPTASAVP